MRLIPAGLAVLMVVGKVFAPGFLSSQPVSWLPLSWWWIIFLPLMYFTAWALSPAFAHLVATLTRRWFLPPVFFFALAGGAVWMIDVLWNHLIAAPFGFPQSHILDTITSAMFGE